MDHCMEIHAVQLSTARYHYLILLENQTRDRIIMFNEPLHIVGKYKYLGITLQTTATSFDSHIQERAAAAIKSSYNIPNITNLSTSTAMALLNKAIAPVITYGIEIIWEKLKIGDMIRIEKIKTMYMKRILGVGKAVPSSRIALFSTSL